MTRFRVFLSFIFFSDLLFLGQGHSQQLIDKDELHRLWEFQSSKLKHGPVSILNRKDFGLPPVPSKQRTEGKQKNTHSLNNNEIKDSTSTPVKLNFEQVFSQQPTWTRYSVADNLMELQNQHRQLQYELAHEISKIRKLQQFQRTLDTSRNQEYVRSITQGLIRSLRSFKSTKYNVPKEHLLQLRIAMLEFLFPNNGLNETIPVPNTSHIVTLNQTDVNTGSSIVAFASGDDNSNITASTISSTPTGNGSVILQTLQDTVTTHSSSPQPTHPVNSNLIKLLQVYGDKGDANGKGDINELKSEDILALLG